MQELGEMLDSWDAAIFQRSVERVQACIGEDGKIHLDKLFIPKWYVRDSKTCD